MLRFQQPRAHECESTASNLVGKLSLILNFAGTKRLASTPAMLLDGNTSRHDQHAPGRLLRTARHHVFDRLEAPRRSARPLLTALRPALHISSCSSCVTLQVPPRCSRVRAAAAAAASSAVSTQHSSIFGLGYLGGSHGSGCGWLAVALASASAKHLERAVEVDIAWRLLHV